MNRDYEAKYHLLEERHWWFRARRSLVRALVLQLCPDRSRHVLEIGCSSGVLIRCLEKDGYASVVGIDISPEAIRECHRRGTSNAQIMDAQKLDFADDQFDVITASDVLEHLGDDTGALRDWHRVLKPGGIVIIFVPAFRLLWSEHDVANQHHRRYRSAELKQKLEAAGFEIERQSYWNMSLFLPIAAVRAVKRLLPRPRKDKPPGNDLFPPPAPVNWALLQTLTTENSALARGMNFPFGVSAMVIARKPRST